MSVTVQKSRSRRLMALWLVAAVGTGLSFGVSWWLHSSEATRVHQEFRRRTRSLVNVVQQVVVSREEALLGLRDLYHHSAEVTPDEFTLAATESIERKPGLYALLWVPRVPAGQRQSFEQASAARGQTDQPVYRLSSGQRTSPPVDAETFPIHNISPHGMFQLVGLDLSSLPEWPAFHAAARTGDIRFAPPPEVLTRDPGVPSCMFAIPVFRDSVPSTEAERLSSLRGYIVGLLDPAVLLNRANSRLPNQGLETLLIERIGDNQVRPLHYIPASGTEPVPDIPSVEAVKYDQHHQIAFEFGGGNWELWTRPGPAWLREQRTYHGCVTGGFGLLFTGLLVFYLRGLFRKTDAIEEVVAQRTAELTETQNRLRADVARRSEIENSFKASEERYRILISQSSDAIWLLELNPTVDTAQPPAVQLGQILAAGRIAECNGPAAQIYGHKQPALVIGRDLAFFAQHSSSRHKAVLDAFVRSAHHLTEHETVDNLPAGESRIFVHNVIGIVEGNLLVRIWVTERELTQQRAIEQEHQALDRQLAETQRLESLGVLAGGIAHDFNNLLTSILGHASLGHAAIAHGSELDMHFTEIEAASQSAANLCQQMLAYAGKGRFLVKDQDLSAVVTKTSHLLQTSVGGHCVLKYQLENGLPLVMADALQIQQIIMNLVLNASEAIGTRGGQINLSTGLIHPDATTFSGCPYAPATPAASYVYLAVQDNGPGMDKATASRVFEPFFTTKFTGRGLGLPATLGIVRSHQGALRVDSQPGAGTTVTLFLPVAENNATDTSPGSATPWQAEGTLLVIDDEATVRGVAERMARSLGFSALSAPDGAQGIDLFRHYQPAITAVLVDLSMPGLGGEETMQQLRALAPQLNLIVMSGYNLPADLAVPGHPPAFLPKPFNITQFQSAIRQAVRKTA